MGVGRVLLLVFGIIIVIISLGMVIGGGVLLWAENSFKDAEGYYNTGGVNISRNVYALVTKPADIHIGSGVPDFQPWPNLKVTAATVSGNQSVFIGIARSADIENYLSATSYSVLDNFTMRSSQIDFTDHAGTGKPTAPTAQSFWASQVNGSGTQTLKWDLVTGEYSILVMNSDATAPVNVNVSVGILFPSVIKWVAIGLIIVGVVGLILGGLLIWLGVRRTGLTAP